MYKNIKKYELRYTDVDAYDNLKLSSLLSFLEESACLSADELGFGYKDVAPRNIGFVLINIYVKLEKNIRLGDNFEIHTWPLKPKFGIFLRDFEIYCGSEKVGVAVTRWCMIDVNTFKILPATAFFADCAFENYNTQRVSDFRDWKIAPLDEEVEKLYSKAVTFSDYDHYFHVNNTKYADYFLDLFSVDEHKNALFSPLQITYCKQCKIGEVLDFYRKDYDGYIIVEGRVENELRVQFKVVKREI